MVWIMNDIDYINQMIFNVCNAYSIDVKDLNKKCNENCYVMARYAVMFILRRHCNYTYKRIKQFVNKDHGTMIYGLNIFDDVLYTQTPLKDYTIMTELIKLYPNSNAPIEVMVNNKNYQDRKYLQFKKHELTLLKKYENEVIRIRKKYGLV